MLEAFGKAAKSEGGLVFVTAFLNPNSMPEQYKGKLIQAIQRQIDNPALQKEYALAYLNAPTCKQYQRAVKKVAKNINAELAELTVDYDRGYVNILMRRS